MIAGLVAHNRFDFQRFDPLNPTDQIRLGIAIRTLEREIRTAATHGEWQANFQIALVNEGGQATMTAAERAIQVFERWRNRLAPWIFKGEVDLSPKAKMERMHQKWREIYGDERSPEVAAKIDAMHDKLVAA